VGARDKNDFGGPLLRTKPEATAWRDEKTGWQALCSRVLKYCLGVWVMDVADMVEDGSERINAFGRIQIVRLATLATSCTTIRRASTNWCYINEVSVI